MILSLLARDQFWLLLGTLYEVPPDGPARQALLSPASQDRAAKVVNSLWSDIRGSRRGYSLVGIKQQPFLEEELAAIASTMGLTARNAGAPTLYLSHDVDYLHPTLPLSMKTLVSERRFVPPRRHFEFLDSLQTLLEYDKRAAGRTGVSTLFVACPLPAKGPRRLSQWLIDPSYRPGAPSPGSHFRKLKELAKHYGCTVGLHGSFHSIEDGLLAQERRELAKAIGHDVVAGRQHWLNLSRSDSMQTIRAAGLTLDSTLGWNGGVGFRSGMARPFPIRLPNGQTLCEVPMLLMDGPLFCDLKLKTNEVVALAKALLGQVRDRNGGVSINWHERAAHADYGWGEAYRQILDWAKNEGFTFSPMNPDSIDGFPDKNGVI